MTTAVTAPRRSSQHSAAATSTVVGQRQPRHTSLEFLKFPPHHRSQRTCGARPPPDPQHLRKRSLTSTVASSFIPRHLLLLAQSCILLVCAAHRLLCRARNSSQHGEKAAIRTFFDQSNAIPSLSSDQILERLRRFCETFSLIIRPKCSAKLLTQDTLPAASPLPKPHPTPQRFWRRDSRGARLQQPQVGRDDAVLIRNALNLDLAADCVRHSRVRSGRCSYARRACASLSNAATRSSKPEAAPVGVCWR